MAKSPSSATDLQVYVRMYRALDKAKTNYGGMLGDCFLIRLTEAGKTSHILIDCGMLMGSIDAAGRMKRIAQDIVEATGGTGTTPGVIDLLVVTHEHWDHISGFSQAQEVFLDPKRLTIANLWMAWTEKDGDPQVTRLRQRFDKAGFALAALGDTIANSSGLQALDRSNTVQSLNNFLGATDNVNKRLQGRDIMGALKQTAVRADFLEPGTVLPTPSAQNGPSLRAFALGPPRDEVYLFKDKPSKGAGQETYLDAASLSDAILHFADSSGETGAADVPFAQTYCGIKIAALSDTVAKGGALDGDQTWIANHYYRLPTATPEAQDVVKRRQVDDDWLGAAGALALKLDSDTNNTSLALAFDLPDGTAMVFAADAQVGNWLSWHQHAYKDETGKVHTAEQILNRTRFYKVGHHGSHNATLDKLGLAMMTRNDLVAAIPTDEAFGKQQGSGWQMPNPRVEQALFDRTHGRIMRNDRHYDAESRKTDARLANVEPGFFDKLTETELYLEYRVL